MTTSFLKAEALKQRVEHWETCSESNGLPYLLFISIPEKPAPPAGYPVIYVLDGNAFFPTIQEQVRLQARRTDKTGVEASIIVGIGYPVQADFEASRRFYDFTPVSKSLHLPPKPDGKKWPRSGGASLFFTFLENEVKPFIHAKYEVNASKQTLFGHSLGGLFTLDVLFTKPHAFSAYIASSPSIWWNQQAVLEKEGALPSLLNLSNEEIRLFLTVGSLEKDYMVKDAKNLSERLSSINNHAFRIAYYEAESENHLSVVPATLSRALRFIKS